MGAVATVADLRRAVRALGTLKRLNPLGPNWAPTWASLRFSASGPQSLRAARNLAEEGRRVRRHFAETLLALSVFSGNFQEDFSRSRPPRTGHRLIA